MTTSTVAAGTAVDEPAGRGSLVVADRVIEKIAAHAAGEIALTTGLDRRLKDRLPGRRTGHARADALVSGRLVQLKVTVGIAYPTSIVSVTREVRSHVSATVSRLCDVDVRDVDVVVGRLRRTEQPRRRVS